MDAQDSLDRPGDVRDGDAVSPQPSPQPSSRSAPQQTGAAPHRGARGEARPAADNTPAPSHTLQRQVDNLLGGPARYTLGQLAERAGVSEEFAATFWKAMSFPAVRAHEPIFTDLDVKALASVGQAIDHELLDTHTTISLLRAQSHTTDRLVLWQLEALVEHAARSLDLDDTSARLVVLDHVDEFAELLGKQVQYAWRRQLAALLSRTDAEVSQSRRVQAAPWRMPLIRGIGFIDMVAYTRRSNELGSHQLADLIQKFEFTARDVITAAGARIVKTIGDAVLFVSEDLPTIIEVTVDLVEALEEKENMLPVRAGVVWGGVLSRSGDVFGPTVNLASRLCDVAPPGSVLTDPATAEELRRIPAGRLYTFEPRPGADLQGMGMVTPFEVRRIGQGPRPGPRPVTGDSSDPGGGRILPRS